MTYADRDRYGMYKDTGSAGPGPALMGADTLIGDSVVNNDDEDLGDIKEIMLDMRTGQVAYAVLAMGGFLGLGEKLFAVPWQALQLDTINKRFVLNIDKNRLQSAPGFDPDAWPDMGDVTWAQQIHSFYGTDPNVTGSMHTIPMGGVVSGGMGAGSAGMGAAMGGSTGSGVGSSGTIGGAGESGLSGSSSGSTTGGRTTGSGRTGGSGTGSSGGSNI